MVLIFKRKLIILVSAVSGRLEIYSFGKLPLLKWLFSLRKTLQSFMVGHLM